MNRKTEKDKLCLYHYFDRRTGPFRSLSAVSDKEAAEVLAGIKAERPDSMCAGRDETYLGKRRRCESLLLSGAKAKGVNTSNNKPHYMVFGHSPWLMSWYERGDFICIPIEEFDISSLSFTYGDSMPTFSPAVNDGKEYRNTVYTYEEILDIIDRYGLPQENDPEGRNGPERYIEAQVWSDETVGNYYYTAYALKMQYTGKNVPDSGISCVPFTSDRTAEYIRLYNESFYPVRRVLDIEPYNWYHITADLSERTENTFLLIGGDRIIGTVSCIGNEVDDLFVRANERGRGYGRRLLLWAVSHIREYSEEPVTLYVADINDAVRLYAKVGFSKVEKTVIKNVKRVKF